LADQQDIYVLTSCYDLHSSRPIENIALEQWNNNGSVRVYYSKNNELSLLSIRQRIRESSADIVYINGLYSLPFVIYPLITARFFYKKAKVVVAPRGMLQSGALKIRARKKKFFLALFKMLNLHKGITWHATDEQEREDIALAFGDNAKVIIAPNIPKKPIDDLKLLSKVENELRLIYLSLITEKKNLHLALSVLADMTEHIVFDIYGPVKDKDYWKDCESIIKKLPSNIVVAYKGDVKPDKVQDTFKMYHALFLPTKGENFGHAIYECLSVGRPVIISNATPWRDLKTKHAGYDCDLNEVTQFGNAIRELYKMDGLQYNEMCKGAYSVAKEYWFKDDYVESYAKLFN